MLSFNKIVKKLWNKWGKVLLKKDIFEIIDPECNVCHSSLLNKTIYRLRAQNIILPIKSWVYIIPESEDATLNSVDLLDKYYLKLLKRYITKEVGNQYYISWLKSLQFHLKDMSIPEKIYVVNRNTNKKIQVGKYTIVFKTINTTFQWKKMSLYHVFSPYKKDIQVDGVSLKISSLELALVESSLVSDCYEWLDTSPIIKAVKKYWDVLDTDIFYEVGKYKYNMSMNRLKEISKPINTTLYQVFLDIIKKNGGCFVGEWLRGL